MFCQLKHCPVISLNFQFTQSEVSSTTVDLPVVASDVASVASEPDSQSTSKGIRHVPVC